MDEDRDYPCGESHGDEGTVVNEDGTLCDSAIDVLVGSILEQMDMDRGFMFQVAQVYAETFGAEDYWEWFTRE